MSEPEPPAGRPTWELRWHPFRGQWVLFTSHRDARPWIGEVVAPAEPPVPDDNALAPLGTRLHGSNPDYRGVYVFTNDLPVFSPDAPKTSSHDDVYRTRRALGTAEVVCYHHDPNRSLADLADEEVAAIVTTWRDRTTALQEYDGVAHVLIFENRGAMVGTSNPHPHCQIYAGSLVYATMAREAEVAREHYERTGRPLLAEVIDREMDGPRVISDGDHFFACVPWFAQYAYEVHILPRVPVASLVDLDDAQCRSLALVLRDVVRRYDALWGVRLPYVLALHQAPVGDHPDYPFHVELHPPLRSPGVRKYLAGPEVGGGSMTNESDPDQKAQELRAAVT
jgi:UDPglucose--hexose-1-phosphate uridylyltransferase